MSPTMWLRLAMAVGIALAITAVYREGVSNGAAKERAVWQDAQDVAAVEAALDTAVLQKTYEDLLNEKDRIQTANAARIKRLARSLSERTSRADMPTVATADIQPSQCTGAQLYREDGNFLVGEAARADDAALNLQQCVEQYESARARLNSGSRID